MGRTVPTQIFLMLLYIGGGNEELDRVSDSWIAFGGL